MPDPNAPEAQAPVPEEKTPAQQAEAQPTTDQAPPPSQPAPDPNVGADPADAPQTTRKPHGSTIGEDPQPSGDQPGGARQPGEGERPNVPGASPSSGSEAPAVDPIPPSPSSVAPPSPTPINQNKPPDYPDCYIKIQYQERPIGEVGVNGCQLEDVLRACESRLALFQAGPMKCLENDKVMRYVQNAIQWCERRTSLRQIQHVEGTNMPHNSTT